VHHTGICADLLLVPHRFSVSPVSLSCPNRVVRMSLSRKGELFVWGLAMVPPQEHGEMKGGGHESWQERGVNGDTHLKWAGETVANCC